MLMLKTTGLSESRGYRGSVVMNAGKWRTKLFRVCVLCATITSASSRSLGLDGLASPAAGQVIDATSLRHKVLCGYQGWFRCQGDPTAEGWQHWSRDATKITPDSLTFEMWPDTSELAADEKFPVPGFTHPDGKQAYLFSSARRSTVERHFQWMRRYGIDGVFIQRFLVSLGRPSLDQTLSHVRASAAETGRIYAICYDLTDAPKDRLYELLVNDWTRLVDELKVTADRRYLHHGGKPVVFVWGFYSDRFGAASAHKVIDFFKQEGRYGTALIGGCNWQWRAEKDREWARALRRFDVICPWNVGNFTQAGGRKLASTGYWKDDLAEANKCGMGYLPVIYPGFSWTNLKGRNTAGSVIPRLGGAFYWRQFVAASDLGIDMAYVAMFDEVDEATAIFKVSNTPPTQARFATYEGMPADWYLRLTGEGSKVIRGEYKPRLALPIEP
jgi:hypothetical protein